MFILVVDDLRLFGDVFQTPDEDIEIRYATNSKQAISILEQDTYSVQEIWFDHDLGIVDGEIDDVLPVINWVEEQIVVCTGFENLQAIRILTSNPVGYQKIKALGRYLPIKPTPKHIGVRDGN